MEPDTDNDRHPEDQGNKARPPIGVLRVAGLALFGLGSIGLFVPFLPTTIFWILAAWAFASSAPELRQKILDHPGLGSVVEDFTEFGVLSRRGKFWSLLGIFGGLGLSAWLTNMSLLWLAGLVALLTPLAVFLITRPEARP